MKTILKRPAMQLFGISIFVALIVGCASIMTGTSQDYNIKTKPEGAHVKIEHGPNLVKNIFVWEGNTPAIVKLRREYEYKVTIALDSYKTEEILLSHDTNGWVWWNLLCGGVLGFAIDLTNGAAKKLQPDELNIELVTAVGFNRSKSMYAIFSALDSNGELRILSLPLIAEH